MKKYIHGFDNKVIYVRYLCYLIITLLLFSGCATYKQLKPEPILSPVEQGYQELKNDEEIFKLKKEKSYFLSFPAPKEKNFYLIMEIVNQTKLTSSLTAELIKKSTPGEKIKDESSEPDKMSVYAVHAGTEAYYWLLDSVPEEMDLVLKYRYVPQWRFKFENHHTAFKATLKENVVDRSNYKNLGASFTFNNFDFMKTISDVGDHLGEITNVQVELNAIQSIFPASILDSRDKAYLDYQTLKKEVEDEVLFQKNYLTVLKFFHKENETKVKDAAFLAIVDDFIEYFSKKSTLPANVITESKKVMQNRLVRIPPFYNGLLSVKTDYSLLATDKYYLIEIKKVLKLYTTAEIPPTEDVKLLDRYMEDFNTRSAGYTKTRGVIDVITKKETGKMSMPDNDFYKNLVSEALTAQTDMPKVLGTEYGFYKNFKATNNLNLEITNSTNQLNGFLKDYQKAEKIVPQLNAYRAREDFESMIAILKKPPLLGFLVGKYKKLDNMSVEKQSTSIRTAIDTRKYKTAESGLEKLHNTLVFLNPTEAIPYKRTMVLELEDALYSGIDRTSRKKILEFVEEKIHELENVDSLYTSDVFMPAYDVKFSSGSQRHLKKKKTELRIHLGKMKQNEFPAKAITLLYAEFIKDPSDNGVLKARAVVAHGKHYMEKDNKIKVRIAECDPYSAKRIRKAKDYRRVFAMPITDKEKGKNRYFFRLNLDVPSKAKFPVWDVNIKLPKAIAKNAATKQWYDKITLNKKLLKNEGRFTISAPTAENKYECQITPVQTKKGKRNIVDVWFTHKSFKVFPISVMVQKPIIKKN